MKQHGALNNVIYNLPYTEVCLKKHLQTIHLNGTQGL